MKNLKILASTAITLLSANVLANTDIENLKSELNSVEKNYQQKIKDLESRISQIEASKPDSSSIPSNNGRRVLGNKFNPSIGVILNGTYSQFSNNNSEILGFAVGEEGERGKEGLSIGESELNFSANIDNKFFGSLTAAIVNEDGEDKIELEEAFIQTIGLGVDGLSMKFGRAFWSFGYLNEQHAHTDDFADRPLPYRVFLNNAFNDDGAEIKYILPTDFYSEIGLGIFQGNDFPFGDNNANGFNAWSGFIRVGGDLNSNQDWRLGGYILNGQASNRASNEDELVFAGDSNLYAIDLKYNWAPTGNSRQQNLTLQGEYFLRDEKGVYEDLNAGLIENNYDESSKGWYAQAIYKFHPQYRFGLRYSELAAPDTPASLANSYLDSNDHDPETYTAMLDWTNSEFSRVRLQYNHENLSSGSKDDQFLVQYIVSFGAHTAHKY